MTIKDDFMIDKTMSLIGSNEDELFVVLVVTVLGVIGFLVKYYLFSGKSANNSISNTGDNNITNVGNNNTTTVDNSTINIGITLEQHKQELKNREKEVTERLTTAHEQEKSTLQIELSVIQTQLNDIDASYLKYIDNLKQRIVDLEKIKADYPNYAALLEDALKQGNTQEADKLYARIEQEGAETVKVVAESAFQRGNIAKEDVHYSDALQHYQKAHNLAPKNTLYLNELGLIYQTLGKYKKAIEYYELTLASASKIYDDAHPHVATYRNNLGGAWDSLGEYKKAVDYYELALESDLKTYGEAHPDVAIRRNNLGIAWRSLGEYKKAIKYFELALKSDLNTYDAKHHSVARDRNNLGGAWHSLGEYKKAIEYFELALASDLNTYGRAHPHVATYHNNLGMAYQSLGKPEKAIEYHELALASDLKTYNDAPHPSVARNYYNLGSVRYVLREYKKAIEYFELALDIYKQTLGDEHPDTKQVAENLAEVKKANDK